MKATLEQKQIQEQDQPDIHDKIRVRCLEVVNSDDQVIAVIGEDTQNSGNSKNLATFFDDDGNEVASVELSFEGGCLNVLGEYGTASLWCNMFGGAIDLMKKNHGTEGKDIKLSIRPSFLDDGYEIYIRDDQENVITLEIALDKGKVTIEATRQNDSEQTEIRTTKTIFKTAE